MCLRGGDQARLMLENERVSRLSAPWVTAKRLLVGDDIARESVIPGSGLRSRLEQLASIRCPQTKKHLLASSARVRLALLARLGKGEDSGLLSKSPCLLLFPRAAHPG